MCDETAVTGVASLTRLGQSPPGPAGLVAPSLLAGDRAWQWLRQHSALRPVGNDVLVTARRRGAYERYLAAAGRAERLRLTTLRDVATQGSPKRRRGAARSLTALPRAPSSCVAVQPDGDPLVAVDTVGVCVVAGADDAFSLSSSGGPWLRPSGRVGSAAIVGAGAAAALAPCGRKGAPVVAVAASASGTGA